MDWDLLALLTPIEWVGDRLLLADVKPRHIGRVITFDYLWGSGPTDYSRVTGTLEAVIDDTFAVGGSEFNYNDMQNIKIWRRVIKK